MLAPASHEFLEHVGELELRVRGPGREAVFVEAGRALAAELLRGAPGVPDAAVVLVELTAADGAALLIEWLNELVYRADAAGLVLVTYAFEELTATALRCRAAGVRLTIPAPVKAATYHGLALTEEADGTFVGRVIFDI
jgi:SHS2 domain-containing protein